MVSPEVVKTVVDVGSQPVFSLKAMQAKNFFVSDRAW
jgi:hypothetical protein